jgi:hypothetical protein
MSKTTYFLRAQFRNPAEAERIAQELETALARLAEFTKRWLQLRTEHSRSCAERRRELIESFRDLEGMIPWGTIGDQCGVRGGNDPGMNCLAGEIPDISPDRALWADDDELRIEDTVSEFASWDGIANWLRVRGAWAARWISEDAVDPFACIAPEQF